MRLHRERLAISGTDGITLSSTSRPTGAQLLPYVVLRDNRRNAVTPIVIPGRPRI